MNNQTPTFELTDEGAVLLTAHIGADYVEVIVRPPTNLPDQKQRARFKAHSFGYSADDYKRILDYLRDQMEANSGNYIILQNNSQSFSIHHIDRRLGKNGLLERLDHLKGD